MTTWTTFMLLLFLLPFETFAEEGFTKGECMACVKEECTYCAIFYKDKTSESRCVCETTCSSYERSLESKLDCTFETKDGEAVLVVIILFSLSTFLTLASWFYEDCIKIKEPRIGGANVAVIIGNELSENDDHIGPNLAVVSGNEISENDEITFPFEQLSRWVHETFFASNQGDTEIGNDDSENDDRIFHELSIASGNAILEEDTTDCPELPTYAQTDQGDSGCSSGRKSTFDQLPRGVHETFVDSNQGDTTNWHESPTFVPNDSDSSTSSPGDSSYGDDKLKFDRILSAAYEAYMNSHQRDTTNLSIPSASYVPTEDPPPSEPLGDDGFEGGKSMFDQLSSEV